MRHGPADYLNASARGPRGRVAVRDDGGCCRSTQDPDEAEAESRHDRARAHSKREEGTRQGPVVAIGLLTLHSRSVYEL